MKKLTMAMAATLCAYAVTAQEEPQGFVEADGGPQTWRLTIGSFGRGNVRTKMKGTTADHERVWGADVDLQYCVWREEKFDLWMGVGGTFCPSQDAYGGRGRTRRGEHQVSEDGFVTYDFNYDGRDRRSVDLGYGEFRLMMVPEWNVTDRFSLGARLGVAFDWVRAKCRHDTSWRWNSRFDINIPGLDSEVDTDSGRGRSGGADSVTSFAAQAIVGIQAIYMFTDNVGLYANCDWRLGRETTFKTDYGDKFSFDLSGWYAGVGLVIQF